RRKVEAYVCPAYPDVGVRARGEPRSRVILVSFADFRRFHNLATGRSVIVIAENFEGISWDYRAVRSLAGSAPRGQTEANAFVLVIAIAILGGLAWKQRPIVRVVAANEHAHPGEGGCQTEKE